MIKANKNAGDTREGFIATRGGNIWYRIVGASKNKIPVIALHGGPAASCYYLCPLEALSNDRPIIFYDQLGCGQSDKPKNKAFWAIEYFVEELACIRKALGLEKIHILGHSWGTMLAVDYMLNAPQKNIKSLILSAPALSASLWGQDQKRYLREMPQGIQDIIIKTEKTGDFDSKDYQDAMMTYYEEHLCRLKPWPQALMKSFKMMNYEIYKYMWGPSEFTVTGTLKNYERVSELKKINIQVLFTCGQFDEATPQSTSYYQNNLPGSELFVFNDASHNHHLEKTELYIRVVKDFLERVENQ
jgi:proline iminopeptidase